MGPCLVPKLTTRAIFVASPPQYRGGLEKHNDLEIQINKYFPNANFFVEKPVSTGVPWDKSIEQAKEVGRIIRTKQNGIVGVGYCLRYLKAVQEMKRIIDENNLTVWVSTSDLSAYHPVWRHLDDTLWRECAPGAGNGCDYLPIATS